VPAGLGECGGPTVGDNTILLTASVVHYRPNVMHRFATTASVLVLLLLAPSPAAQAAIAAYRAQLGANARPAQVARRRHGRAAAHAAIVGGTPASEDTFPWLAFIVYKSGGESLFSCTGTVVAPNVVLTAGHCAESVETGEVHEPSSYTVITGNVQWTASARQVSSVSRVIVYPGFDRGTLSGDAALLVLSTPTTAPPITLASATSDPPILKAGTAGIVAGWGKSTPEQQTTTERLQWADTVVQQTAYCERDAKPFDSEDELCAIDAPGDEAGICFGDSGAPLFARNPTGSGVVELALASHLYGQCSTTRPAVYTRADLIAPWVGEWIAAVAPALAPVPALQPLKPTPVPGVPRHRRSKHRKHRRHRRHRTDRRRRR
jgi:secreted trypsin-like serine protease